MHRSVEVMEFSQNTPFTGTEIIMLIQNNALGEFKLRGMDSKLETPNGWATSGFPTRTYTLIFERDVKQ